MFGYRVPDLEHGGVLILLRAPAFWSANSYVNRNFTRWSLPLASFMFSSLQVSFHALSVFHT